MTTNSDNDGRIARLTSSRRSFLSAAAAAPAVLGLGLGSYEAAARFGDDDDFEIGLCCALADDQDQYVGDRDSITVDPRFLSAHDLSVGQQVRLSRSDDEFAVYTIANDRPEAPQDIVRASDLARHRLELEALNLDETGGLESCPDAISDGEIDEDDEFEVDISTAVPHPSLSEAEARQQGELIERAEQNGTDLLFLAPHGGGIQPYTDDQAERAAELADASSWRAKGWGPNTGAFARWYVPSMEIDPASYPELDSIADEEFDAAVDFGGVCDQGITVDGSASVATLEEVRDSINDALAPCAVQARLADDEDELDDDLLVDRLSDEGVFISQSYSARRAYCEEIALGTAAALSEDVDVTQDLTQNC